MVEVKVVKSNCETIQRHREMLEDLVHELNENLGSTGKVSLGKERIKYNWVYLISQKKGWLSSRHLAVFDRVGCPEFRGYEKDDPINVNVRVYTPEVLETVKRVVTEYAGKPESNVAKVEISQQF